MRTTDMFGRTYSDLRSVTIVPGLTPGDGARFADAREGLRLRLSSDAAREEVRLIINGEDRSDDFAIEGGFHRWEARTRLRANRAYEAELRITKSNGRTITHPFRFDTFDRDLFVWGAADYNFEGGRFLDRESGESYRDKNAIQGIDKNEINHRGETEYRPQDGVSTQLVEDERMRELNLPVVVVGGVARREWLNYTRTFPRGRFHVFGSFIYGRLDGNLAAQMDRVISDPSKPNQITQKLGVFGGPRNSGSWWEQWFYPLKNDDGSLAVVEFDGKTTLRVTNIGEVCGVAFFLLVPVEERRETSERS